MNLEFKLICFLGLGRMRVARVIHWTQVPFINLFFYDSCFLYYRKEIFAHSQATEIFPVFSFRNFIILVFICRSMVHSELIFLFCEMYMEFFFLFSFLFLCTAIQLIQHNLLKRLSFLHWIVFAILCKIIAKNQLSIHVRIQFYSVLLTTFLFSCKCHTVLITAAFWYSWNKVMLFSKLFSLF